jgi:hypothetical protein
VRPFGFCPFVLSTTLRQFLKKGSIPDKRPTLSSGSFMGMGGQKHDAIDYLTARIQRLENKIETVREQVSDGRPQQYGVRRCWSCLCG